MGSETDGISSAEGRILGAHISGVREDVKEIKTSIGNMQRAMETLVRMEEQQRDLRSGLGRAFDEVKQEREKREALEGRVAGIAAEIPSYRELRKWVIGGIVAGIAMMAAALFKLAIVDPAERHRSTQVQVQQAPSRDAESLRQ